MRKGRLFWGIFALIGAVILLGSQLNWFDYPYSPWILILTLFLVATLITSLVSIWLTGTIFSLAALSIVYANVLGIEHISIWLIILIAILVDIGVSLLFHPWLARRHHRQIMGKTAHHHFEENIHSRQFSSHNEDEDTELYFIDKLTSSTRYLHNKQLERVVFEVSAGELKAYFDDVTVANSELIVDLNVTMGQVELFIPKEWQISNELAYAMSTVNVPKKLTSEMDTVLVHLRGKINFAEVNVHYI